METRRRSIRGSFGGERPYTKKERESLGRTATCPPIAKKCPVRIHLTSNEKEGAISLSYKIRGALDKAYDKKIDVPYLYQVFNVVAIIGEGSFGVVYKAIKKEDGRTFAIKVSKQRGIKGMTNEVKTLEKIGTHPNIVKYHFAWKEMGNVFIQFEYCVSSLAKYSRYNHKIRELELWDIFLDMILGLQHLHAKKFLHLDIKPDNILISIDGTYKLGDFGLLVDMLQIKADSRSDKVSEGDAKYLPKEVLEGQYSPAGDMFSLGITLLELAADLVLPTNGHLWHSLRNGDIPAQYLMVVPDSLQQTICNLMVANYKKRPTAEDILHIREVKQRLLKRDSRPRVNYYEQWLATRDPTKILIEAEEIELPNESELVNNNNYHFLTRKSEQQFVPDCEMQDKASCNISRQLKFDSDDEEEEETKNDEEEGAMELIVHEDVNMDTPPSSKQSLKFCNESQKQSPEPMQTDQSLAEAIDSTPNHVPAKRVSKMILFSL